MQARAPPWNVGAEPMAAIQARLDLPPKDAVAFFERKGDSIAWDWTDVWREQNVHAFTVAKVTDLELLRTIRAEVGKAIGEGQTFEQFSRTLRPRLQDLGWWGSKEVLDAGTGELTKVRLGSNRRLRTIFQTNVQTAYMAGRYKRYLDNVADRPYWQYVGILDGRIRPAHLALHGKVWRWNDPIWSVIWPPNGWGCRCRVRALTEAEFQALGVELQQGEDMIGTMRVPINRDGDQVDVKVVRFTDSAGKPQVFRPDPGWDYNPGEGWSTFDPSAGGREAIGVAPVTGPGPKPRPQLQPADGLSTWADAGRPLLTSPEVPRLPSPSPTPGPTALPLSSSTAEAAGVATRIISTDIGEAGVISTPLGEVAIRPEQLVDALAAEPLRDQYFSHLVATLRQPFEVWLTPYADGSYRTRYLALFEKLLMLVRLNRDGSLSWDAYELRAADFEALNRLRAGTLLYGSK